MHSLMVGVAGVSVVLAGVACGSPESSTEKSTPPATTGRAWTASPRHVGPIRIGMTVAEAETALAGPFDAATDSGECVYRKTSALPGSVLFMQVGGRIVRVDITAPGVATDEGIEVGATEARVHDVYGSQVAISPHKYTDGRYLTIAPETGYRAIFETDGERVTRYRVGRVPEVDWVEGCS
jgi:hypothetical protein